MCLGQAAQDLCVVCDAGDMLNLDIASAIVLGALVVLVVALFRLSRRRRDR